MNMIKDKNGNVNNLEKLGIVKVSEIKPKVVKSASKSYLEQSVYKNKKEKLTQFEADGFIPFRETKHQIVLKKDKIHSKAFEQRVWSIFVKIGFHYINSDEKFKIEYADGLTKQIDVFTMDDECILVVECKSSKSRKKVNYQKDINELIGLKTKLIKKIRKDYSYKKQKIAFIFATNNSVIGNQDRKRLKEENIHHLNQDAFLYLEQLADHLGDASKYQFMGKLFEKTKIPELKNRVPAVEGKLGKFRYYSFSIEPLILLKLSYVFHRTDVTEEAANSYQRLIKKSRIKKIGEFIDGDGFFPNCIIIAINSDRKPKFDLVNTPKHDAQTKIGILHLPKTYRSCWIIDGQHRLFGYAKADKEKVKNRTVPVVAFHNLPQDVQSKMFVDINHKQVKVPQNLLGQIMQEFNWKSEIVTYAMAALRTRLINNLDSNDQSPFYSRIIKSEDKKTEKRCLTSSTIIQWGLSSSTKYFGVFDRKSITEFGTLWDRDYDKTLIKAVSFFISLFNFIERKLTGMWEVGSGPGGFISMNIGVGSIMKIVDELIIYLSDTKQIVPSKLSGEQIAEKLEPYLIHVTDFIKSLDNDQLLKLRSHFGTGGVKKAQQEYRNVINENFPDFIPKGFLEWKDAQSGEWTDKAEQIGDKELQPAIRNFITMKLQAEFGEQNWWRDGVPIKVQKKCSDKKIDSKTDEHESNFLTLPDYEEMIKFKESKHLWIETFTEPGTEQSGIEKKLAWIGKWVGLRNKYDHPERKNLTAEEYQIMSDLKDWLYPRLKSDNYG
jgi:DNA sulfur modification protein DndB